MTFESVNPFDQTQLQTFEALPTDKLDIALDNAHLAQKEWAATEFSFRRQVLKRVANLLQEQKAQHAQLITLEMGKPLHEAIAEVEKCAWVCDYYADHAAQMLSAVEVKSDARYSEVRYDALGLILGIMPWNFPYWQVFRFAAPSLMAGNGVLLKHAPNVFGCSEQIATLFEKAGLPQGVFTNLIVHHEVTEGLLADKRVAGVSLTGSVKAGSAVASLAGKYIKPSLLELGGSNAFIVCDDADLSSAIEAAVYGRMRNAGQSCIAAKRFLVVADVYEAFKDGFVHAVSQLKVGNPMNDATEMGPLARVDLAENLERQVHESIAKGAKLVVGGKRSGAFFEPTILENVTPNMPAFCEETFGPLAALTKVSSVEQAIDLAMETDFGLGLSIFTSHPEKLMSIVGKVKDGGIFFNSIVKSDPRLPFGGSGSSGYGRELGASGIRAFTNEKVVYIN